MKKNILFIFLSSFCFINAIPQKTDLFYDHFGDRIKRNKELLVLRSQEKRMNDNLKKNLLFYDYYNLHVQFQLALLQLKANHNDVSADVIKGMRPYFLLEAAGGTKEFMETYKGCSHFMSRPSSCFLFNQLKRYQKRLQSKPELIEELKSEIKETKQTIHNLTRTTDNYLVPIHHEYLTLLSGLLEDAQKSS